MICGFGIYDGEKGKASNKNIIYKFWSSMVERCYSEKMQKKNPTYIGITVCDDWKRYSNFEKWANKHYISGYELDKDIITINSKIYSPETCSFVPSIVNSCILDKETDTMYPIGVSFMKERNGYLRPKPYRATISCYGKVKHLGSFSTQEEAHLCWQQAKCEYIIDLIKIYKNLDSNVIAGLQRRIDILKNDINLKAITYSINKV